MDLITHVTGITNSGSVSPGANTPAPFNVPHTGAVDGSGPSTATKNMAEIYNRLLLERAAIINMLGSTIDNANWVQASAVLKAYLDAMNANIAGLNTNINTVSAGLAAEQITRAANDVKRCGFRKNATQAIANNVDGLITFDLVAGLAWNSGATIVIPAGTANNTWFRASGQINFLRQVGSSGATLCQVMKNAAVIGNTSKSGDAVGAGLPFEVLFQANALDAVSVRMLNLTGGTVDIVEHSCFAVERF